MITRIYVQHTATSSFPTGERCYVGFVDDLPSCAILFQQEQYQKVLEYCKNAEENSIIMCPEIGLHIDYQERMIDAINNVIGDKPLQIFTHSATVFFPHHANLVERL